MKSQKLKYNLSGIIRYAHRMFTVRPMSMSERLKKAWAMAKEYMESGKADGQFVVIAEEPARMSYRDLVSNWYETSPRGTYFGD